MIILCNGAFKSGSSWLFQMVRKLARAEDVPEEWRNPAWDNPSLDPDRLGEFLERFHGCEETYASKNHLPGQAFVRLLTETHRDHVKVLNMRRDIRDVVVSAYYHHQRVKGYSEPFEVFFRELGLDIARRVSNYNRRWNNGAPNNFFSSYESLKTDGPGELRRIAGFLGLEAEDDSIENALRDTQFEKLQKASRGHLRKGIIGDWKNHLANADVARLREVADPACFSPLAD